MSKYSQEILRSIENAGISYGKLSKLTNIPKSALQRYATGETKKIPIERLREICRVLEIPMSDFEKPSSFVKIPIIGRVSAGSGCLAENEILGYDYADNKDISDDAQYCCLRVTGDSMYPKFEDGDIALIRSQASVDSGSFAVVIVDNADGVIKKLVYGQDWVELQSINPMYPPRRFEGKDINRIRVLGLVKSIKRNL